MFKWIHRDKIPDNCVDTIILTTDIEKLFGVKNNTFGKIICDIFFFDEEQKVCIIPILKEDECEIDIAKIKYMKSFQYKNGKKEIAIHKTGNYAYIRNMCLHTLIVGEHFNKLNWRSH